MLRLLVVFCIVLYSVNGQPIESLTSVIDELQSVSNTTEPDKIIDILLDAFNNLYTKPISIPGVEVNFDLPLNDFQVRTGSKGLNVNGTDFSRINHAIKSGDEIWQVAVDVGNISFSFHNLTVSLGNESYPATLSFHPYELPVLLRLERNVTSCTVSSGPFHSGNLPAVEYSIDLDSVNPAHREVLCQLHSNQDFIYEYFLQAFFASVQDPIYLLVKQFKLCPQLNS